MYKGAYHGSVYRRWAAHNVPQETPFFIFHLKLLKMFCLSKDPPYKTTLTLTLTLAMTLTLPPNTSYGTIMVAGCLRRTQMTIKPTSIATQMEHHLSEAPRWR